MGKRAGASALCGDMRSECHPERVSTIDMCMAMSGTQFLRLMRNCQSFHHGSGSELSVPYSGPCTSIYD